jgi:hypothetical protein
MRAKAERDWVEDPDTKSSLNGGNVGLDSKPEAEFGPVETPEVRQMMYYRLLIRLTWIAERCRCESDH